MRQWEEGRKEERAAEEEESDGSVSEKTRGDKLRLSRTSAGLAITVLDTAIARPFPTARCVHAGLGRPHSRGGANGRHQGKGFSGGGAQRSACR